MTVMEWVLEPVDPGELPPGHKGPLPKVKVLEIVNQNDGSSPVSVIGQYLLVRVQYSAFFSGPNPTGTLMIEGDTWEKISVPLSFFPAQLITELPVTPLVIGRGQSVASPIVVHCTAGQQGTDVTYEMSRSQLHTGISIQGTAPSPLHVNFGERRNASILFKADSDAPLGANSLAIDQLAFGRHGFLLPVDIKPNLTVLTSTAVLCGNKRRHSGFSGICKPMAGIVDHDLISLGGGAVLVGTNHGGVWGIASSGAAFPHSDS